MAPRVSIVLPTYNERGNLEPLLAQLLRAGFTPPVRRDLLAASLAALPWAELQLPADALLSRCRTLAPLTPAQRTAAEALWRASTP